MNVQQLLQNRRTALSQQVAALDAVIAIYDADARNGNKHSAAIRKALQIDDVRHAGNGHRPGGSAPQRPIQPAGTLAARVLAYLKSTGTPVDRQYLVERFQSTPSGIDTTMTRHRRAGRVKRIRAGVYQYVGGKRSTTGKARKAAKTKRAKRPKRSPFGPKWYALLKKTGPQGLTAASRTLGAHHPATLLSAGLPWIKAGAIQKTGPGVYAVGEGTPPTFE